MWCTQCVWPPDASQLAPNSSSSAAYYYPAGTTGYGTATGYSGTSTGTNTGTYGATASAYGSSAPIYGSSHSHGGAGGPGTGSLTPSGTGVEAPSPYGSSSSILPSLTPATSTTTSGSVPHHVYNGYSTGTTQPPIHGLYSGSSLSSYDPSLPSHHQHTTAATAGNNYTWVGLNTIDRSRLASSLVSSHGLNPGGFSGNTETCSDCQTQ